MWVWCYSEFQSLAVYIWVALNQTCIIWFAPNWIWMTLVNLWRAQSDYIGIWLSAPHRLLQDLYLMMHHLIFCGSSGSKLFIVSSSFSLCMIQDWNSIHYPLTTIHDLFKSPQQSVVTKQEGTITLGWKVGFWYKFTDLNIFKITQMRIWTAWEHSGWQQAGRWWQDGSRTETRWQQDDNRLALMELPWLPQGWSSAKVRGPLISALNFKGAFTPDSPLDSVR